MLLLPPQETASSATLVTTAPMINPVLFRTCIWTCPPLNGHPKLESAIVELTKNLTVAPACTRWTAPVTFCHGGSLPENHRRRFPAAL